MKENTHIKKKRQEFVYNIRKTQRQEKMRRKRNLDQPMDPTTVKKHCVVDQKLKSQLLQFMQTNYQPQEMPNLAQLVMSESILEKHRGVIGIRKILCNTSQETISYFIRLQLTPHFVMLMQQDQYLQLKLEASWVMANLLNGNSQQCKFIMGFNLIPIFVNIVMNESNSISEQGIWALGNLAADSTQYRDQILQHGGLKALILKIDHLKNPAQIRNAAWSLSNICRGTPAPKYDLIKEAVPTFGAIIKSKILDDHNQILSDCIWALSYLSDGPKIRLQRIIETNVLPKICQLTQSPYPIIFVPSIRILGNCSAGNQYQTKELLKCNFLDIGLKLLSHDKKIVRREVAWIMSNICAGTQQQALSLLLRGDIVKKLYQMLQEQIPQIKIEVCWIFTNVGRTCNPKPLISLYSQLNLIYHVCQLLKTENTFLIRNALDCLYKLLVIGQKYQQIQHSQNQQVEYQNQIMKQVVKSGYGTLLEQLQENPEKSIYQSTFKILERFFNVQ